jgi:hypothetical protein
LFVEQPVTLRENPLPHFIHNQSFFIPSFLVWLERFPGVWASGDVRLEIDRRSDGGLAARDAAGAGQSLIDLLGGGWRKVEAPPGPLGFRPVILSEPLVWLWLGPEQAKNFKYAMFVSAGPKILVKRIETVINETPLETRELKWFSWWRHNAEREVEPLTEADLAEHQRLFECFQRDLG